MQDLDFDRDGARLYRAVYDPAGVNALCRLHVDGPGVRLHHPELPALLQPVSRIATALIGPRARPVRAVLFDKTSQNNWAVAWHQDRTIVVTERRDTPGFGPWSVKQGALHVAPPIAVLERMATFRIHLDACDASNAPLLAARGSHRLGYVAAPDVAARALEHEQITCLAEPGDVWAYSTPILHASERATRPARRRVLQVDYAADPLPGGLIWRGVAV